MHNPPDTTPAEEHVYLNGRVLPARETRIDVFDAGFTHAAGLFETLRTYDGKVFRLGAHLDRLAHSAAVLEMRLAIDHQTAADAIDAVLSANRLRDARIRLVMTPGPIPRDAHTQTEAPTPTLLISASPVRRHPPSKYEQGMRVCISPYKQNRLDPLAGHKTLSYFPRLLAMKEAAERSCDEALWFTTENLLAEGCICNVFIVKDGKLFTPPLQTPILPGISRQVVIEIAAANGIALSETPINIEHLLAADEVFLTGSVLEVMPVTSIEKHIVGEGVPGSMSQRLRQLYTAFVARECGLNG